MNTSNLKNTGLVLEGGGLRGIYTSGVIRCFMDKGIFFPYVIGVSMGACNAANYISQQPERNRIVNTRYVKDSRYISYLRLLTKGELFGMNFIFDTIPNSLMPFNLKTFMKSDQRCITAVTDCTNGMPRYYEKREAGEDFCTILQGSCSLPFISKPVQFNGHVFMDGCLTDPVPVQKSMDDGNLKNVLILTRPKGYRKKRSKFLFLTRFWYPKYKGLQKALEERHTLYNNTMDLIDTLEKEGKVFVIRPETPLNAGQVERNKEKLYLIYDQGYADTSSCFDALNSFLGDNRE
ncbi:patatin family protein [Thermodesulfobacteriota bacterium]